MVYRVEFNDTEVFYTNYDDASQRMMDEIDSLCMEDLKYMHENGGAIYIYKSDTDTPIERFYEGKNKYFIDHPDDIKEIIANEFECDTYIDFQQMSDFQLNHSGILGFWYSLVCDPHIYWENTIIGELECVCKDISDCGLWDNCDWYGDYMPKEWVKQLSSAAYYFNHDFHFFADEFEDVYKQIEDAYETYRETIEE